MLHYHLSILLFVDVIEATDRHDLLVPLAEVIAGTEATVLNTLVFGLHNSFTLAMKPDTVIGPDSTESMVKVSLIAIDPYPHHVVAAIRLIRKGIDRDFYQSKISLDAYDSLQSTLKTTVDHLPQSSKSVQAASGLTSYNTMNGTF